MADRGVDSGDDDELEAEQQHDFSRAKRTIGLLVTILSFSILRSGDRSNPSFGPRVTPPSQIAEAKTGYAFVPGKYIVGFQLSQSTSVGGSKSSTQSGAIYTDKSQFIEALKTLSALSEEERASLVKRVAAGVATATRAGMPLDGKPHTQLDEDIVILFALRLIEGRRLERVLPVRGLGFVRPDGTSQASMDYRIEDQLVQELGLSLY